MGDDRAMMLEYIQRQLIGPWGGEEEQLREPPQRRYLTGILFPREADADADPALADDISDEVPDRSAEDADDDPLALAGQQLPSSVGLSFVLVRPTTIMVEIEAARYVKQNDGWRREPVALTGENAVSLPPPPDGVRRTAVEILGGFASVEAVWRRSSSGPLVTVALVNRRRISSDGRVDPADCLFQVSLRCRPVDGHIGRYPSPLRLNSDEEDEELALLYRNVPTYAVGHGAAATWSVRESDGVEYVETTYLPRYAIPAVDFDLPGTGEVLSLAHLAQIAEAPERVLPGLRAFVDDYDNWAARLEGMAAGVDQHLIHAARRLLDRVHQARSRMRRGIALLEEDPVVRHAFALANRAVLLQMIHSRPPFTTRRRWTDPVPDAPDVNDPSRRWRPFQLAFLLLTLESIAIEGSAGREVVDLIWFPTGGGKTEAYLGAIAFAIFHRRLRLGDEGAGVTVMTRYTLRLLTTQQFQRATALVCACETVRAESPELLGSTPISIGIWVGSANSPNSYAEAVRLLEQIRNGEQTNGGFQLELCPWCGTELIPDGDAPQEAWGIYAANDAFRFLCPNAGCYFHGGLPVSSVDEDLYNYPPTVLVGTVDKFARLAWEERAGVFLGAGETPGPSLIIQDEFHLISGPLGTIVGLYEAAFDTAIESLGTRPKILASTATIRRSADQTKGVFGRPVALFPPAGLNADDSYFIRFDRSRPGRLYVGVMPQGHTPLTAMVHLSAVLLQGASELPLAAPYNDAYWTMVAYHNSLRELGKTVTLARDDVPARMQVIASDGAEARQLTDDEILELTSNVPAAEIPRSLERLSVTKGGAQAVSLVASTNMISVGVDVQRLGLMLVVGQPKTTAEYIQATSRVGRSVPGLVVTLYSPAKPRDRSHYESFVPYHSSLYRFVEPTSVTPFSVPARQRALHAALIVLARHVCGWAKNDQAGLFDSKDPQWESVVETFLHRVAAADPEELPAVERHIAEIAAEWEESKHRAEPFGGLRYRASGKQQIGLLRRFGEPGDGWPTLDSMRSVDVEVRMLVRGGT